MNMSRSLKLALSLFAGAMAALFLFPTTRWLALCAFSLLPIGMSPDGALNKLRTECPEIRAFCQAFPNSEQHISYFTGMYGDPGWHATFRSGDIEINAAIPITLHRYRGKVGCVGTIDIRVARVEYLPGRVTRTLESVTMNGVQFQLVVEGNNQKLEQQVFADAPNLLTLFKSAAQR